MRSNLFLGLFCFLIATLRFLIATLGGGGRGMLPYIEIRAAAPAPQALGSPNLTVLFALNDQIPTKSELNEKHINLGFRASNKCNYFGARPIY